MPTNPRYKCLVFDWDGTLIDSIERITTSLQTAARKVCGLQVDDQTARDVIGMGLMEAIARLLPDADEATQLQAAEVYKQDFLYDNPVPTPLFEGVRDMLEELKAQGYLLAVATGKSRPGLDRALQEHAMQDMFVTTRCAGEYASKPHPEMLLSILNDYRIDTAHSLMIGDSEHDMLMAGNAGVDAIGVTHGAHDEAVLMQFSPLACLQHVTDLYTFLGHTSDNSLTDNITEHKTEPTHE